MSRLWIIFLSFFLASCSTINFVNGPRMDETIEREQWHHIALWHLIEVSRPMDVDYKCGRQEWDTVTVERTFFNGIAEVSWPFVSLYAPMTIIYECRDPIY